MRRNFLSLGTLLIVSAAMLSFTQSTAAGEAHPLIKRALNALQAARTDLLNAAHDYCGHRVEALEATNAAINELQKALDCADRNSAADSFEAGESNASSAERHPNINRAISALGAAEGDLQNAARDYCGHRVKSLEAIRAALSQLRLAVECDK
jgi:siderophore synthetase component